MSEKRCIICLGMLDDLSFPNAADVVVMKGGENVYICRSCFPRYKEHRHSMANTENVSEDSRTLLTETT